MPPATDRDERRQERLRGGAARRERNTRRKRVVRRRRAVAVLAILGVVAVALAGLGGRGGHRAATGAGSQIQTRATSPQARAPFPVATETLQLVDGSRLVRLPSGATEPRRLPTLVLYPAAPHGARGAGPFPLVVFAHGFGLAPQTYSTLLGAWAREGYVVAAPAFPLESSNAPGGPNQSDLPNQPRDVTFVISALLARSAAAGSPLSHLIDASEVAVAGHSDGGETALAVAYGGSGRDPRVKAAVILAGAEMPGVGTDFAASNSPPLLAVQGTADTVNPPGATDGFFAAARPPKYLLSLFGAAHIPPYSDEQPQLGIVERVSLAFFDRYLKGDLSAARRLGDLGPVPKAAGLASNP